MSTQAPSDREALKTALRDLEAAESRVERNAQRVYDETRSKLVTDLLPVLDNLDRTLRAADHAAVGPSDRGLVTGVEMVKQQLEQVLARYGAERIDAVGERFDPALHHAVAMIPVEPERRGTVVEQAQAGYRFAGRVLRPAMVVVGTSPAEA